MKLKLSVMLDKINDIPSNLKKIEFFYKIKIMN
jgi:hypothetical protein